MRKQETVKSRKEREKVRKEKLAGFISTFFLARAGNNILK